MYSQNCSVEKPSDLSHHRKDVSANDLESLCRHVANLKPNAIHKLLLICKAQLGQGRDNAKLFLDQNKNVADEIRQKILIRKGMIPEPARIVA